MPGYTAPKEYETAALAAYSLIDAYLLAIEADLMLVKWQSYRFTDLLSLTDLMRVEYNACVREYIRSTVDIEKAALYREIGPFDLSKSTQELSTLWALRQSADALGLPYRTFMSYVREFVRNRPPRKKFPRPNQIAHICEKFFPALSAYIQSEVKKNGLAHLYGKYNFNPLSLADQCLPGGRAQKIDVLNRIDAASNFVDAINEYVLAKRLVTLEDIESGCRNGKGRIQAWRDNDRKEYERVVEAIKAVDPIEPKFQCCFGIVGARHPETYPCDQCSHGAACHRLSAATLAAATASTGGVAPRQARKREVDTERQRRHREKKKLANQS